MRTLKHSAEFHLVAKVAHCVIESLDVVMLHSHLRAHGDMTNYASPVFTGAYSGTCRRRSSLDHEKCLRAGGRYVVAGRSRVPDCSGANGLDRVELHGNFESGAIMVPAANRSKVFSRRYARVIGWKAANCTLTACEREPLEGASLRTPP